MKLIFKIIIGILYLIFLFIEPFGTLIMSAIAGLFYLFWLENNQRNQLEFKVE